MTKSEILKQKIGKCKLVKDAIKRGVGFPDIVNGKCSGYTQSEDDDDEPHNLCKICGLSAWRWE